MLSKYPSSFAYKLEDNTVILVFWKDGVIYEDVALFPKQQKNPEFEEYSFDNSSGLEIWKGVPAWEDNSRKFNEVIRRIEIETQDEDDIEINHLKKCKHDLVYEF